MAVDTKTAILGVLIIGMVAMAGWVGFLYVNPVTKTRTKTDEETEYITNTVEVPVENEDLESLNIPTDWSDAPLTNTFSVYDEDGAEHIVQLTDLLYGVQLYIEQENDPEGKKLHDHKPEYMGVNTVIDPVSGDELTGVNLLDVLEFCDTYYAMNISIKSKQTTPLEYFNTTILDILDAEDNEHSTLIAFIRNGTWQDNFTVVQAQSTNTIYDLEEIRTLSEWEVKIYVNNTLQDFRINRTNIIDPFNPGGWTYGYHKKIQDYGGKYNYNRTFYGMNMSYLLNQTADILGYNYTMRARAWDGFQTSLYNNIDINEGIAYPNKYGLINSTSTGPPWSPGVPLLQTDLLVTMAYKEWRWQEYGLYATDPVWDNAYMLGYGGGPFKCIIPGQTGNKYPGGITEIRVTTYSGPIP